MPCAAPEELAWPGPRDFMRSVEEYFRRIYNDPGPRQRSVEGTPRLVVVMNAGGFIGYKNMQFATNDDIAEKLSAENFLKILFDEK